MRARFWEATANKSVQCHLCPHECEIAPGALGICAVRENRDGVLRTINYGSVSSSAIDPVEKKPLYHFFPGSSVLSFGTFGCNFSCRCCQNFRIAKEFPRRAVEDARVSLDEMRATVDQHADGVPLSEFCGVAYTYSEPIVWAETVLDLAPHVRARGLKNVLVTNGFICREPLEAMLEHVDALNIDLKAMDDAFYQTYCGGRLQPVLDTIAFAAQRAHVELTTLVIPTLNDDLRKIRALRDWVADTVGPHVPLHISRYYPTYKLSTPPTPPEVLERARDVLCERLQYVYIGNVGTEQDTVCAGCGHSLISRQGYRVSVTGLTEDGACAKCGVQVTTMK